MDKSKLQEQVKAEFTGYLTMHKHRKTPERFAILEHIYQISGHFDMDTLFNSMKNSNFRVSRATLYNTIELLLDSGLVVKHQFGANVSQYERAYGNENHDHFICLNCREVKEYKNSNLFTPAQQKRFQRFQVSYYSLYIYGICNKCQRAKKAELKKNKNLDNNNLRTKKK
ncbi:Fur family transcriptional regulator [Dysgonomonas sp. 25]|uniref:Fur family transcriptional regulator n=1 Tax=Dysgonomonas sp. 25 TaxID=2302933 RepID=UPI0013D30D7E|nr:transcriptional repressor [Dysgonomonas sp. 25]NDV68094.1 transcriptional repressor [Dysgonomonas sp. 25]